jgi:hypothetical protein
MTEEITQEEDFVEVWTTDENGNKTKIKLYWHNQVAPATIEFYVVHLQVTHRP